MSKHIYRILRTKPIFWIAVIGALMLLCAVGYVARVSAACLFAGNGQFRIKGVKHAKGKMRMEFESETDKYVEILVSDSVTGPWEVADIQFRKPISTHFSPTRLKG